VDGAFPPRAPVQPRLVQGRQKPGQGRGLGGLVRTPIVRKAGRIRFGDRNEKMESVKYMCRKEDSGWYEEGADI